MKEGKNILTRFWYKKSEEEAEKSIKDKGMTNKEIKELNDGSRTEYLDKISKV